MAGWEVRPRDPRRERQLRLLLVVLVVAVPTAFWAGQLWRSTQLGGILDRQGPLQQRLAEQDQELELLRQRLAVVSSGERLSQQANEQSRQTIKLLEEQIFKLQQELSFYKGVLAPASRREGLRIRAFELQATDQPRRFRYKVMLSRVGQDDKPLEGRMRVIILGRQGSKDATLELAALSDELPEQDIPFAFKHFQAFPEGGRFAELQLPEGFTPHQIKVSAEVQGQKPLERTFKWIDEE